MNVLAAFFMLALSAGSSVFFHRCPPDIFIFHPPSWRPRVKKILLFISLLWMFLSLIVFIVFIVQGLTSSQT